MKNLKLKQFREIKTELRKSVLLLSLIFWCKYKEPKSDEIVAMHAMLEPVFKSQIKILNLLGERDI